jgi:hypothetical protein
MVVIPESGLFFYVIPEFAQRISGISQAARPDSVTSSVLSF